MIAEKIMKSIRYGRTEEFLEMLADLDDVNMADSNGQTPLYLATRMNRIDMVQELISRGANVNCPSCALSSATYPLHIACQLGHLAVVRLLLAQGADPMQHDTDGLTAVHVATKYGRTFVLTYLLALNYSPDVTDASGCTPLMTSVVTADSGVNSIFALITYGAHLNRRDYTEGNTALHIALKKGIAAAAKILIENNADLSIENHDGETPLEILLKGTQFSPQDQEELLLLATRKVPELGFYSANREWPIAIVPGVIFAWTAGVLKAEISYLSKVMYIVMLFCALHFLLKSAEKVRLGQIFPLSFILTLKLLFYSSWYKSFFVASSIVAASIFVVAAISSTWLFVMCLQDPGYCYATAEVRDKNVVDLCEKNLMDERNWCGTCVLRKPLRSKHCQYCGKCVARFDHHCPFLRNCIGWKNHVPFVGFLSADVISHAVYIASSIRFFMKDFDIGYHDAEYGTQLLKLGQNHSFELYSAIVFAISGLFTLGLLAIQLYQIVWLGMTTNERLNWKRYKQDFYPESGKTGSPFDRGLIANFAEFLEFDILGYVANSRTNWNNKYNIEY